MSKKPRLLLVGNFLSGQIGTRSICEDLAERLFGAGYEVIKTSSRVGRIARILDMGSTILSRRRDYDLAYVEVYSGLAFVWAEVSAWLLSSLRKPFILALHGGGLPAFAGKYPDRMRRLLSQANVVVTPSLFIKESLASFSTDIRYLPNAIDLGQYGFRLRERPTPHLMWLRAFHDIYHPEMAVYALFGILKIIPEATLTMLGPDKQDDSLKRILTLIAQLNLEQKVTIRGPIEKTKVPLELNAGDIFINTTRFESFGVSVLEAAACGLPVVTTDVGELSYLWQNDEAALLVPADDVQKMTNAIERLLTEPGLAERLSICARRKAEQFDWSVVLPQWEQLLLAVGGVDDKIG